MNFLYNLPAEENNRPLRIALYSHDTCGLGHMRRNLLIAETLVEHFPNANILLITGAREVASFRFPDRVDAVSLPSLYKKANENYSARSLSVDIKELIHMRANIIRTSIEVFNPDVFIVDKVARGTMGELDDTLAYLSSKTSTRCVLGLRDILDGPEVSTAEWYASGSSEAVKNCYDSVWIYGDERVYDFRAAYNFSADIEHKIEFAGYLDPSTRLNRVQPDKQDTQLINQLGDRFFVCAVGGGQDGAELALSFAHATFPEGVNGLIVTGPHMPAEAKDQLQAIVDGHEHLTMVGFLAEPLHVYRAAERIVCMGGYNTTLELLGLDSRALIVPRVFPREEQWIRSQALSALGLIDHLHPDNLSAHAISNWFREERSKPVARQLIDLTGLNRIPSLVNKLVSQTLNPQLKSPVAEVSHAIS